MDSPDRSAGAGQYYPINEVEFEEIVYVTNKNANQLRHARSCYNHAENTEHPGQILSRDFQSKVERHDDI